jgi:hypothetical protein
MNEWVSVNGRDNYNLVGRIIVCERDKRVEKSSALKHYNFSLRLYKSLQTRKFVK